MKIKLHEIELYAKDLEASKQFYHGVLGLPPGASRLIQTHLYRLYEQFGVFSGATLYPTLFELLESIRNGHQANAQSRQALIANLEPVLLRLGEDVLGSGPSVHASPCDGKLRSARIPQ